MSRFQGFTGSFCGGKPGGDFLALHPGIAGKSVPCRFLDGFDRFGSVRFAMSKKAKMPLLPTA